MKEMHIIRDMQMISEFSVERKRTHSEQKKL